MTRGTAGARGPLPLRRFRHRYCAPRWPQQLFLRPLCARHPALGLAVLRALRVAGRRDAALECNAMYSVHVTVGERCSLVICLKIPLLDLHEDSSVNLRL